MRYLYCPKCKELRVKPWYQRGSTCNRCFGVATPMDIPNSWLTYLTYALYVTVPAIVVVYLVTGVRTYIWIAVAGMIVMMIVAYADISRGAAYAKKRIKIAGSDLHEFRRRGWT